MDQNEGNQQTDNKLFKLIDIINNPNEDSAHQKLNIPDNSINSNTNNISETIDDDEEESKLSLNPNHNDNMEINDSGLVQIPKNFEEDQSTKTDTLLISSNDYSTQFNTEENILDESISYTILRDINLIYFKLRAILNPFSSNYEKEKHIREWDLWGPLLFITFLSFTLSIKAENKSNIIVLIFSFFWIGSVIVFINGKLLDSKIKLFPIICLLGYCLFPLNISAFIMLISNFYEIIRFIIIVITYLWSLFSIERYLNGSCIPEQKLLVFYPIVLLFSFISWFIFAIK